MAEWVVVTFERPASAAGELALTEGLRVEVLGKKKDGWWQGRSEAGSVL